MLGRTEETEKYGVVSHISNEVLDDGPAVVELLERMQRDFHAGLEREHRVMVTELRHEQEYDAMHDVTRAVVWALTIRDPEWLASIGAEVQQAVAEDQQWWTEQRGH